MEKLKPYLVKIKQHHVWVLFLVATAVLFYAWSSGAAKIKKDFKSNQAKIKSQFASIDKQSKSRGGNNFPNESWIESREKLTNQITQSGTKAWDIVKESQAGVQSWPASLHEQSLVEIEQDDWNDETISDYQRIVGDEIQQLRVIVDAVDTPDKPGVLWNVDDYKNLEGSLSSIKNESDCKTFQQVLWIYQALVRAIQQTNEGTSDRFDLPIFAIEDTASFLEVANAIGEQDWLLEFDAEVVKKEQPQGRKSAKSKKDKQKKTVSSWKQEQIRQSIESASKSNKVDGFSVVPFRLKVRMELSSLESFLRSLSNSPIPLIIEGMRFEHHSALKTIAPKVTSRGGRRRGSRSQVPSGRGKQNAERNGEKDTASAGRGTLIEIWGFAYLVEKVSRGKDSANSQSAQRSKKASFTRKQI
ncbi:MAG: hypothetical protein P8K78_02355 [Pirellulales bacterium]|nr:hypothetical protein [Pirellulales bacterium]